MRKIGCLTGLLLLVMSGVFHVTAQEEAVEWVNTLGRGTIVQAALSADGERVVVGGSRGVWVYDSQFNDLTHIDTGAVWSMAWSSDDLYLAVLNDGNHLSVWNMLTYQRVDDFELAVDELYPPRFSPLAWQPNSHLLALVSPTGIALWNAETGHFEDTLPITTEFSKTDLVWSPDGSQLAVAAYSEVQVWDLRVAAPSFYSDLRDGGYLRLLHVAWSLDGSHLAIVEGEGHPSSRSSNNLSIIDMSTGETTLVIQSDLAADVAWSPDGTMIATATAGSVWRTATPINVWDAHNGRLVAQLAWHSREAYTVQWFPDGQHLLSAAYDNTARIWQIQPEWPVNAARENRILRRHMDRVNVLAWSPEAANWLAAVKMAASGCGIWSPARCLKPITLLI